VSPCSSTSESTAIPMATMEFAALCLDNALLLLPDQLTAGLPTTTVDGSSEQRSVCVSVSAELVTSRLTAFTFLERLTSGQLVVSR